MVKTNLNGYQQINTIEGITFTDREIDIVACMLHGRSVKKIAYFFLISPKTVEVHIRNIMLKIGCNSRERIIDFIESSKNHLMIIDHYHLILEKRCGIKKILTIKSEDNCIAEQVNHSNQTISYSKKAHKTAIFLSIIMCVIATLIICYYHKTLLMKLPFNIEAFVKTEPKYLNSIITSKLARSIDQDNLIEIKIMVMQSEKFLKNTLYFLELDQLKYQIGRAYRYLGRFQDAITILEGIKDFDTNIHVLSELGTDYLKLGQYNKAILLIEKALDLSKTIYGSDSIQAAHIEILLDTPYRKLKRHKEAKKLLEHSLKIHNSYKDLNVIGDIAWIYTKLGYLNTKLGNLDEAIKLFEKSLEIQINLYGKNNIRTAWTYVRMAGAYKALNNYSMAKNLLKDSLKVYRKHYGVDHIKSAWVLGCLAEIEALLNNISEAKKCIVEALEIQTQYYGSNSIRLSWALNILSKLYKKEQNPN